MGYIVLLKDENYKITLSSDMKYMFLIEYLRSGPSVKKVEVGYLKRLLKEYGLPSSVDEMRKLTEINKRNNGNGNGKKS